MKILLIDTSDRVCGAAVTEDGRILGERALVTERAHSVQMMPLAESLLCGLGLKAGDMDAFAAVAGPGSFTGIRIGLAAVKAFAQAFAVPCVGVDALEALAFGEEDCRGLAAPMIDARAGRVYTALFRREGSGIARLTEDRTAHLPECLRELATLGEPVCFSGSGAEAGREAILETLGGPARFSAVPRLSPGRACLLAERALASGAGTDARGLAPVYVQLPQAQRIRTA